MALNPYFIQGTSGEQSLVQDLINEQLRMYGVEVYYLPRQYATTDNVIKEVIQSEFNYSYPIEAYVDNFDGYGDNTVMLSKFGIQAENELTVTGLILGPLAVLPMTTGPLAGVAAGICELSISLTKTPGDTNLYFNTDICYSLLVR